VEPIISGKIYCSANIQEAFYQSLKHTNLNTIFD